MSKSICGLERCTVTTDHDHCYGCCEIIPVDATDKVCSRECHDNLMADVPGPVSWCCICGGLGNDDGSSCWGCQ